jgi:hypothetical protein
MITDAEIADRCLVMGALVLADRSEEAATMAVTTERLALAAVRVAANRKRLRIEGGDVRSRRCQADECDKPTPARMNARLCDECAAGIEAKARQATRTEAA